MAKYVLESCIDTVESAMEAEKGGANRIELCSNLIIGGTTPNIHLFDLVKEHTTLPINPLIRPRFGDFCYSNYEFEIMKRDIKTFKGRGANGVVIGMLLPDGSLDTEGMKKLIEVAGNMDITLHRAFDMCKDPFKTLDEAKKLGINTILTSGQKNNCLEGKVLIKKLVEKAQGQVDILVGAGVGPDIMDEMLSYTMATSYHMSGKVTRDSQMTFRKEDVSMGLPMMSEYEIWQTDANKIAQVKAIIEKHLQI